MKAFLSGIVLAGNLSLGVHYQVIFEYVFLIAINNFYVLHAASARVSARAISIVGEGRTFFPVFDRYLMGAFFLGDTSQVFLCSKFRKRGGLPPISFHGL